MSHTPGPWVPRKDTGLRWRIQTAGDKGTLAYMTARPAAWAGNFSHGQIEENAHLIAAAPDLLEALQGLVENSEKEDNWAKAFSAIKKAKGL
jgi:hypothetical protein